MAMPDYPPLSLQCVKQLTDKVYDKRKAAVSEIESITREALLKQDPDVRRKIIEQLLDTLIKKFAESLNPNYRKGGVMGLSAVAVTLGKEGVKYREMLIMPVLEVMGSEDPWVRYFAAEALYNIIKVLRTGMLPYFCKIFNIVAKLHTDPSQQTRSASQPLNRHLKEVIKECPNFSLDDWMLDIRERLGGDPYVKLFVIEWIKHLNSIPDISVIQYLPDLLDGLFSALGESYDPVRQVAEKTLAEILDQIRRNPENVQYSKMINILIIKMQKIYNPLMPCTAAKWIHTFLCLSGVELLDQSSGILISTLPCLSNHEIKGLLESSFSINEKLKSLIPACKSQANHSEAISTDKTPNSNQMNEEKSDSKKLPTSENKKTTKNKMPSIHIPSIVEALCSVMKKSNGQRMVPTRIAILKWIYELLTEMPKEMLQCTPEVFPMMMNTLLDKQDEVVLLDLEVLAKLARCSAKYRRLIEDSFTSDDQKHLDGRNSKPAPSPPDSSLHSTNIESSTSMSYGITMSMFMKELLVLFKNESQRLDHKPHYIVRQLCVLLSAEDVYLSLASNLLKEDNVHFAASMVLTLNNILLTSTELFELRQILNQFDTKKSHFLFTCLYKCWCHSPVATVSLCLLSRLYDHAAQLLTKFDMLEISVELLCELDTLVHLIESPVFTFLRLQLLHRNLHSEALIRCLYGLLMLLPQSDAFFKLKTRLDCVSNATIMFKDNDEKSPFPNIVDVDFEELMRHFEETQRFHKRFKHENMMARLTSVRSNRHSESITSSNSLTFMSGNNSTVNEMGIGNNVNVSSKANDNDDNVEGQSNEKTGKSNESGKSGDVDDSSGVLSRSGESETRVYHPLLKSPDAERGAALNDERSSSKT